MLLLVHRTQAGDRAALRELLDREVGPAVFAAVVEILRVRGRSDPRKEAMAFAEDALVHLIRIQAIDAWTHELGPMDRYLVRIAENRVLSSLRGPVQNPWSDGRGARGDLAGLPFVVQRETLRKLFDGLRRPQQALFFLFAVHERTPEEVAGITQVPLNVVLRQRDQLVQAVRERLIGDQKVSGVRPSAGTTGDGEGAP